MNTLTNAVPARPGWLYQAEAWLDARGKGAWIALMVLGLIFFWPIGLAILAYMIWSKKMFATCKRRSSWSHSGYTPMSKTGNSAFDAYKEETLRRLEQEQRDFHDFLTRLREAKDKAEFDEFMSDRARAARAERRDRDEDGGAAEPAA